MNAFAVAQIVNLPYRRLAVGCVFPGESYFGYEDGSQTASLRYGRLPVCVTKGGATL
jgi:hypothetical protein